MPRHRRGIIIACAEEKLSLIHIFAAVIIVLVLLITSRSYAELPVMILTFASAALLNMGTNFWFGTISFLSLIHI